jgi:UDP-glucose 4-epimerase
MFLIIGYGLIGKSLYRRLKESGQRVMVISRTVPQNHPDFVSADINAIMSYERYFDNITTVIHCLHTTVPATSFEDELYDIQSNLMPFVSILNICKRNNVRDFIYISSGGAVYGLQEEPLNVNEMNTTNPLSSYGITKLACEKYLQLHRYDFKGKVYILRPSNVYGNNQKTSKPNGIIGHAINACANDLLFRVWGSGNGIKDYLYVEDLIDAIILLINSKKKSGNIIYNIASGYTYTINQILSKVENRFCKSIYTEYSERKIFDVESIVINSSLFRANFNWAPTHTLDQFLDEY